MIPMLTIQECRQSLDAETNQSLDDTKVEEIRNDFYKLARIILSAKRDEDGHEYEQR